MGVAWKEWTQKFKYNLSNLGKAPLLVMALTRLTLADS